MDQLKRDFRRSLALIAALDQRATAQSAVLDDKMLKSETRFDALQAAKDIKFLRTNSLAEADFLVQSIAAVQRHVDNEIARLKDKAWDGQRLQVTKEGEALDDMAKELELLGGTDQDASTPEEIESATAQPSTPKSPEERQVTEPAPDLSSDHNLERIDPNLIPQTGSTNGHGLHNETHKMEDQVENEKEIALHTPVHTGSTEPNILEYGETGEPTPAPAIYNESAITPDESATHSSPVNEDKNATTDAQSPLPTEEVQDTHSTSAPLTDAVPVDDGSRRRSARLLGNQILEDSKLEQGRTSPDEAFFTPPLPNDDALPVQPRSLRRSTRLHTEDAPVDAEKNETNSSFASPSADTPEDNGLADRELAILEKLEKLGASTDVYTTFMETNGLSELEAVVKFEGVNTKKELTELLSPPPTTQEAVPNHKAGKIRRPVQAGKKQEDPVTLNLRSGLRSSSKAKASSTQPAPELPKPEKEKGDLAEPHESRRVRSTRSKAIEDNSAPPAKQATQNASEPPLRQDPIRLRTTRSRIGEPRSPLPLPTSKRKAAELNEPTAPPPRPGKVGRPSNRDKADKANSNVKAYSGVIQLKTDGADQSLYCVCQRGSFGRMIACDNTVDCPYEWYHLVCLGLKHVPGGTWFCPTCVKKHGQAPKTHGNLGNKKREEPRRSARR